MERNIWWMNCTGRLVSVFSLLVGLTAPSKAFEFSIIESGPEAAVSLWIRGLDDSFFQSNQLISPAGETLDSSTVLEDGLFSDLVRRFDSLEDAIGYVQGTWHATVDSRFPERTATYDFSIEALSIESINRAAPELFSPTPAHEIRNGSTFLFAWDYPEGGEMPSQSRFLTIPQFDPLRGGGGSVVSTPTPGGTLMSSGSIGTGDERFSRKLTNVPGTDKNRFLYTLEASEAALPLDVEITLGSHISLEDQISLGETTSEGFPPFPTPRIGLFYSRQNDPFTITLSHVPEPTSVGLVIVMIIGGAIARKGTLTHR